MDLLSDPLVLMNVNGPGMNSGSSQPGGTPGNGSNNNGPRRMSIDFLINRNDDDNDNQITQGQNPQGQNPWVYQPIPEGFRTHHDEAEFSRHLNQTLVLNPRERILNTELKGELKSLFNNHHRAYANGVPYDLRPSLTPIGTLDQEKHNLLCRQVIEYTRNNLASTY